MYSISTFIYNNTSNQTIIYTHFFLVFEMDGLTCFTIFICIVDVYFFKYKIELNSIMIAIKTNKYLWLNFKKEYIKKMIYIYITTNSSFLLLLSFFILLYQ